MSSMPSLNAPHVPPRLVLGILSVALIALVLPGYAGAAPAATPAPHELLHPGLIGPMVAPGPHDPAPPAYPVGVPPIDGLRNPATGYLATPTGYTKEPAPMGIGDFGVSGSTGYQYGSYRFLGIYSWTGVNIGTTSGFTVQLNVVLQLLRGGTTYAYWIQDVAVPTTSATNTLTMSYEDNIWNFSAGSGDFSSTTLTGNGTIASDGSSGDYYYTGTNGQPGSTDVLKAPNSFELLVTDTSSASGEPVVRFEYKDPSMSSFSTYDTVTFKFPASVTTNNGFYVDGNANTPDGLYWDAEVGIGGPGGGSSTTAKATTNSDLQLYRYSGTNYESTPSFWNFGDDTGETISSIQSIPTADTDGRLGTAQLNGTTKDDAPAQAFLESQVGTLWFTSPTVITGGAVVVGADHWGLNGSTAQLTLNPGTYPVWVNGSSSTSLGTCTITAGGNLSVSAASPCSPGSSGGSPTLGGFTATPNPVDQGSSTSFSASASGGTGTLTYSWNNLPAGCTGTSTSTSLTCAPTATGSFNVELIATDTKSNFAAAWLNLTVNPTLVVSSLTFTPSTVTVNTATTVDTVASGGTSPLHYTYTGLPSSCSGTTSTFSCTPTTAATYSVIVDVSDAGGGAGSVSASLTVNPAASPPTISSFQASPGTLTLGGSTTISTVATGGTPAYSYAYSGLPTGCTGPNAASFVCDPSETGTFTLHVTVTDSNSLTATQTTSLTVNLPAGPTVTLSASATTLTLGSSVTFTADPSGGYGALSYAWTGLPAGSGCSNQSSTTLTCQPSGVGTSSVAVEVRDAAGRTSGSNTVNVTVDPTALDITSFVASPSQVKSGAGTQFEVQVTGGVTPYTFSYTGLPSGCSSANTNALDCTPSAAGWSNVTVTVTDSAHQSATQTASLQVLSNSTSSSPPSNNNSPQGSSGSTSNWLLYLLIIAVIAAVVVLIVVLRRKPNEEPPYDDGSNQYAPQPGGFCTACGAGVPPGALQCPACGSVLGG